MMTLNILIVMVIDIFRDDGDYDIDDNWYPGISSTGLQSRLHIKAVSSACLSLNLLTDANRNYQ